MPESFLGDGLIFEELLPLAWTAGPLAAGLDPRPLECRQPSAARRRILARRSARVRGAQRRIPRPAARAAAAGIQAEHLAAADGRTRRAQQPAAAGAAGPARHRAAWNGSARRLRRWAARACLSVYINAALPQPLKIPCIVAGERVQDGERVAQLRFSGLSDAVVEHARETHFSPPPTPRRRRESSAGAHLIVRSEILQRFLRDLPTSIAGICQLLFSQLHQLVCRPTRALIEQCQRVSTQCLRRNPRYVDSVTLLTGRSPN